MKQPESLYTTKDVTRVREELLKKQVNCCELTQVPIPEKQAVLDHDHKTQLVRAVLHRQSNAALGKIENVFNRFLAHWYPGDLIKFLYDCREYLIYTEYHASKEYYHPGWLKKVKTEFNKLRSSEKDEVICRLDGEESKNDTQRKKQFSKLILNRSLGYDIILNYINESKGA